MSWAYTRCGLSRASWRLRTSGVSAESIRNARLSVGEQQDLAAKIPRVAKRQNWIFDDRSGISAQEVVRSVRRHKKRNGTKVVVVDYIQLLAKPNPRMTTHEALSESITTLADAAKHDGIAYVVMSQLNREIEKLGLKAIVPSAEEIR